MSRVQRTGGMRSCGDPRGGHLKGDYGHQHDGTCIILLVYFYKLISALWVCLYVCVCEFVCVISKRIHMPLTLWGYRYISYGWLNDAKAINTNNSKARNVYRLRKVYPSKAWISTPTLLVKAFVKVLEDLESNIFFFPLHDHVLQTCCI